MSIKVQSKALIHVFESMGKKNVGNNEEWDTREGFKTCLYLNCRMTQSVLDELKTHEKSLSEGMMMLAMSSCKKVLSASSPCQSTCMYPTFYLIIKASKRL